MSEPTIIDQIMMQSINRFLYGPSPEERVRAWQTKLRAESRQLDREMRQVCDFYLRLRTRLY
jgi:charged multivesicular body protein 3